MVRWSKMRFDEFWSSLQREISVTKRFRTLRHGKEFKAVFNNVVTITPTSQYQRTLKKNEFEKVWNRAKNLTMEEQFKRVNYNDMTRNGSYILCLMKHIISEQKIE